jgi:hypothetical protein
MSSEDALLNVMIPVAERLLEKQHATGNEVDLGAIAEAAIAEFTSSIAIDSMRGALRERLVAHLRARHG